MKQKPSIEQRDINAAWNALQDVPSYVEQQAAHFAAEYTLPLVQLEDGTISGGPATTIWNVSDDTPGEVD